MKLGRWIYIGLLTAFAIAMSLSIYFALKALHYKTVEAGVNHVDEPLYHLVLIPEEMDNPYWHLVEKGAKDAAKKYHVIVEYNGPQQTDMDQHIRVVQEAIASKVDGIITQGLYPKRTTSVINQAVQQGIPVVTVDTDDPTSERTAYVGTNNYESGVLAGQTLIDKMHGKAKVGIITGSFAGANQQARVEGFKEAIKKAPGIQIVEIEESNITQVQAAEKTYEILKNHPDVNAFFGTSALDGLGISAVTTRYAPENHIYVLAYDTLSQTLDEIRKGNIDQTISQTPYQMGYQSVELMVEILNGKQVPKLNYTETKVIGNEDLLKERGVN
jgi:ribose transport system substrate-binding protein